MLSISALERAISDNTDIDRIVNNVSTQDLSRLSADVFEATVRLIMSYCYENNGGRYVKKLLSLFKEGNPDEDAYSVAGMLVCNLGTDIEYLRWLSENGLDLQSVIELSITSDVTDENVYGVRLCLQLEQYDIETLRDLQQQTIDAANNLLLLVIDHAIGTHPDQVYAPIPAYLTNTRNMTLVELLRVLPPPTKPIMTLMELAIASAFQHKVESSIEIYDQVRDETYEFLRTLTDDQVREFANNHFGTTNTNLIINRTLGPVCAFPTPKDVDEEFDDEDEQKTYCSLYGGCHHYHCMHFVTGNPDLPEDGAIGTWFTGYCVLSSCLRKIYFDRAAVRKPRIGGGFLGCYCSFDCIRKSEAQNSYYALNLQNAEASNGDEAGEEDNKTIENQMTDIIEEIMNRDGVELPVDPEDGPDYIDRPWN